MERSRALNRIARAQVPKEYEDAFEFLKNADRRKYAAMVKVRTCARARGACVRAFVCTCMRVRARAHTRPSVRGYLLPTYPIPARARTHTRIFLLFGRAHWTHSLAFSIWTTLLAQSSQLSRRACLSLLAQLARVTQRAEHRDRRCACLRMP